MNLISKIGAKYSKWSRDRLEFSVNVSISEWGESIRIKDILDRAKDEIKKNIIREVSGRIASEICDNSDFVKNTVDELVSRDVIKREIDKNYSQFIGNKLFPKNNDESHYPRLY